MAAVSREIYEVWDYGDSYRLRSFTDRDTAEEFLESYRQAYGYSTRLEIKTTRLYATCPTYQVRWESTLRRNLHTGGVGDLPTPSKKIYWEDAPTQPPDEPTVTRNSGDTLATIIAPSYDQVIDLASKVAEDWTAQHVEKLNSQRAEMMSRFLGVASPMINEGM